MCATLSDQIASAALAVLNAVDIDVFVVVSSVCLLFVACCLLFAACFCYCYCCCLLFVVCCLLFVDVIIVLRLLLQLMLTVIFISK